MKPRALPFSAILTIIMLTGCGPTAMLVAGGVALLGGTPVAINALSSETPKKPGSVRLLEPENNATAVPLKQVLTWKPTARAERYYIFFGTTNPPAYADTLEGHDNCSYDPLGTDLLGFETSYYWQVVANNGYGNSTSALWEFYTYEAAVYPFGIDYMSPSNNSTNISVTSIVSVHFNQEVDPASVNDNSFFITEFGNTTHMAATTSIGADNQTIILVPYNGGNGSDPLSYGMTYEVTLTTEIQALAPLPSGRNLSDTFYIRFETEAEPPYLAVRSISPYDGELNVSISKTYTVITVVFNADVDRNCLPEGPTAALDNANFTINPGLLFDNASRLSGTIAYDHRFHTAALALDNNLENDKDYTITLVGGPDGIRGMTGAYFENGNYISQFRTRSPELIKSWSPKGTSVGVYTPVEVIFYYQIGNSATSSIDSTNFYMKYADPFGCVSLVDGEITYNPTMGDPNENKVVFTPERALLFDTTYTVTLENGISSLDGSAFLWEDNSWTFKTESALAVSSARARTPLVKALDTDVPVQSYFEVVFNRNLDSATVNSSTVWIEELGVPLTPTAGYPTLSLKTVTLAYDNNLDYDTTYTLRLMGGEPVGASPPPVLMDTYSNFLADNMSYTFRTSEANRVYVAPANASDVSLDTIIVVMFSRAVNTVTLPASFTIEYDCSTEGYDSWWSADNKIFTAAPYSYLEQDTTYTVRITTGLKDTAGNPLESEVVKTFLTGSSLSIGCATLAGAYVYDPPGTKLALHDAVGVSGGTGVRYEFDDYMKPSSFITSVPANESDTTLLYYYNGPTKTYVSGAMSFEFDYINKRLVAIFTPTSCLQTGELYYAEVTDQVADLPGNPFEGFGMSGGESFTIETAAPLFSSSTPADSATVGVDQVLGVTFSEDMLPASIIKSNYLTHNLYVLKNASRIDGTVSVAGPTAAFAPANTYLVQDTSYELGITIAATDLAGNPLATGTVISFDTQHDPLTVTLEAAGGPVESNLRFNFNRKPAVSSLTYSHYDGGGFVEGSIHVKDPLSAEVFGLLYTKDNVVTFKPAKNLEPGTAYTVTVTTSVTDLAGNPPDSNAVFIFTTD